MRDIGPELAAAIAAEVMTLAMCWRLVRADGVALGFTSHDRPLTIGGIEYRPSPGLSPSAVQSGGAADPAGMEAAGALTADAITEADLALGRFDGARCAVFLVDWSRPEAGHVDLSAGVVGDVACEDGAFRAELGTVFARLSASALERFSPECRALLGDARCTVDLARHTIEVVATGLHTDGAVVVDRALGAVDDYRYGRARVLSGALAGLERQIAESAGNTVRLDDAPAGIEPGARIELRAGCDKRFETCRGRFDNAANFRGEPHVPGLDAVARYPGL